MRFNAPRAGVTVGLAATDRRLIPYFTPGSAA
jgi:hypothetical protein